MNNILTIIRDTIVSFIAICLFFSFLSYCFSERLNIYSKLLYLKEKVLYKQRAISFKYFIKRERCRLTFIKFKGASQISSLPFSLKEIKTTMKERSNVILREMLREIKLIPLKSYLYLNNFDTQFKNDPFVKILTSGKYDHYDVYNIYNLDLIDLFKVIYIKIMSNPEIYSNLKRSNLTKLKLKTNGWLKDKSIDDDMVITLKTIKKIVI